MKPSSHSTVFFLVVLFLASWHLFGGLNDNVTSRAAMVSAIVEQGSFRIDTYAEQAGDKALINGHYYSEKAPLPALLVVPFWWAARATGIADAPVDGVLDPALIRLGGFLIGSLPFAIIVTLLWYQLRRSLPPQGLSASIVALSACFGSFLFVQSGAFFGHLIGGMFLLLALLAFNRNHGIWCGLLSGCAVLCEYTNAVFPLLWAILLFSRGGYREFGAFVLGGAPALLLLATYNTVIAGTPFMVGYSHQVGYDFMHSSAGMGWPNLTHLWHITLSDYRGLLFYAPVLALAIMTTILARIPKWWKDPVLLPALLTIVAMSGFGGWWGGWTYGPRYLSAVAVLLFYRCLPSLASWRWSTAALPLFACFGMLCTFAAKDTVGFSLPTEFMHPMIQVVLPAVGTMHAIDQWPVLLGVPARWCSVLFLLVFVAAGSALHLADRRVALDRSKRA